MRHSPPSLNDQALHACWVVTFERVVLCPEKMSPVATGTADATELTGASPVVKVRPRHRPYGSVAHQPTGCRTPKLHVVDRGHDRILCRISALVRATSSRRKTMTPVGFVVRRQIKVLHQRELLPTGIRHWQLRRRSRALSVHDRVAGHMLCGTDAQEAPRSGEARRSHHSPHVRQIT